jgi:hypothetical protein
MAIYSTALRYMIHLLAIAAVAAGFGGGLHFHGWAGATLGVLVALLACGLGLGSIALLFEIRDNLVRLNSHRLGDDEARPELNRREPQFGR